MFPILVLAGAMGNLTSFISIGCLLIAVFSRPFSRAIETPEVADWMVVVFLLAALVFAVLSALREAHPALSLGAIITSIALMIAMPRGLETLLEWLSPENGPDLTDYTGWASIAGLALMIALAVIAANTWTTGWPRYFLKVSESFIAVNTTVGKYASFLFLPLMGIITYDIIQRKLLDYYPNIVDSAWAKTFTSTRIQEMEWHLHGALFLMCLGYAYTKDAHVRIELVRDRLNNRMRGWLELLGCIAFLIPYCWLISRMSWKYMEASYRIGEVSAAMTGLSHRWVIKAFLPAGFILLGMAGIAIFLKCVVYLFGPESQRREAGTHVIPQHEALEHEKQDELKEIERETALAGGH